MGSSSWSISATCAKESCRPTCRLSRRGGQARVHRRRRHRRQLTCYGAIVPDDRNLGELATLALQAQHRLGRPLLASGGNSGSIDMVVQGRMPAAINTLRIGETILLGVDTLTREPTLGLHLDAFVVEAPIIECKVKPSLPTGTSAQDAFGNRPTFTDRGVRRRAICAIGRQDAPPEGLRPLDPRIEILGGSSDHLILDVDDLETPPVVGDGIRFVPNYGALLQLCTCEHRTSTNSSFRMPESVVARGSRTGMEE